MFAVLGDPAQVKNKFSLNFSFDGQGFIFLNRKWSEYDVTLLVASLFFY